MRDTRTEQILKELKYLFSLDLEGEPKKYIFERLMPLPNKAKKVTIISNPGSGDDRFKDLFSKHKQQLNEYKMKGLYTDEDTSWVDELHRQRVQKEKERDKVRQEAARARLLTGKYFIEKSRQCGKTKSLEDEAVIVQALKELRYLSNEVKSRLRLLGYNKENIERIIEALFTEMGKD